MLGLIKKTILRLLRSSKAKFQGQAANGYVEALNDGRVEGWLSLRGQPKVFRIGFGGDLHVAESRWVERSDVQILYPEAPLQSGFSLEIPRSLWEENQDLVLSKLEVRYGNKTIPLTHEARTEFRRNWTVRRCFVEDATREIQSLQHPGKHRKNGASSFLQLGLTLISASGDLMRGGDVALQAGGHLLPVEPLIRSRNSRCTIDLPPELWDHADAHGHCVVEIFQDKTCLGQAIVRADVAADALELLRARPRSDVASVLLGLEHARVLAKYYTFHGSLRTNLLDLARRFGCTDYLCEFFPGMDEDRLEALSPASSPDELRYIKAFDDLTKTLLSGAVATREVIASTTERFELNEDQGLALFESSIGDACRKGRFEEIEHFLSDSQINDLAQAENAFRSTIVMPFLAARGQLDVAVDVLHRLPSLQGWVSTECLKEASRRVAQCRRPLEVRLPFFYALISYIDQLRGQYWSFQYNREISGTLVPWLEQIHLLPKWMARDLVNVTLRTVSLSEDFWNQLPEVSHRCAQTERLNRARQTFNVLACSNRTAISRNTLLASVDAARQFQDFGNPDADTLLRELSLSILADYSDDEELVRTAEREISRLGELEPLRAASHPALAEFGQSLPADLAIDLIRKASAESKEQAMSGCITLQEIVGREVEKIAVHHTSVPKDLKEFTEKALRLNSVEGGWLSADVMLRLANRFPKAHEAYSLLLCQSKSAISSAVSRGAKVSESAALQSAFAQLRKLDSTAQITDFHLNSGDSDAGDTGSKRSEDGGFDALTRIKPGIANSGIPGQSDTLVVIYSCRKYLDDRIPRLRRTWINDLKSRGIPYVVLVGDGDDTLEGDVLRLDVQDTYEALPAKTLKMIDWVYSNTDYQYLMKIDDDCYFSVDQFFDSMSYRKFHYYGRVIHRGYGATKRDWHREKSKNSMARNRLDRSPEPSRYCDGGAGYCLSRFAMNAALSTARSDVGRWLVSVSYFEDKLVGDLLATKDIEPSNEDYLVHILRKPSPKQTPVTTYENRYYPSQSSPVTLVHLDEAESIECFHKLNGSNRISPLRIWPTHQDIALGWNSHQLEFIAAPDRLDRLRDAQIVVVAVVRNEMALLPQFLTHYRALGVSSFLIADNLSDDGSREYLLGQEDVVLYSVDSEYSASHYGVDWQQAMLGNHCVGKWTIVVDADEFLTYPGVQDKPISEITAGLERDGYNCAGAALVDMYPSGKLSECDFTKGWVFDLAPYHDDPPVIPVAGAGVFANTKCQFTSALRHRLLPGSQVTLFMAYKFPLVRYDPLVRLSEGLHFVGNVRISPDQLTLAHFKYHAGFAEKIDQEIKRAQHYANGLEYQKYRIMMAEARGELYAEGVSRRIDEELFLGHPTN